jgi:tRNA G18 (ribose-2'-O)-methylase SpoU
MRPAPERYMSFMSEPDYIRKPDPRYNAWERNVIDEYKSLPNDEIKARVEANRLPYAVLMTHINIDYNLGTVLRIGNCLGAKVYYYGERRWDKRGALGVWHYSPITHLKSIEEVRALKEQYSFVALEQTKTSVTLPKFVWPKNPLILLGEESCGLEGSPEILELAEHFIEIPQRGSVRSLNAGTAFAIAAYDYSTKLLYSQ